MHSDFYVTLVSLTLKCPHVKCVCVVHPDDVNLLLTDVFSGMWSAAVCLTGVSCCKNVLNFKSQTVLVFCLVIKRW